MNLIELGPDKLESIEVPLLFVLLQVDDFFLELVKLLKDHGHLDDDRLLPLLAVLEVSKCLLLEEAIDK